MVIVQLFDTSRWIEMLLTRLGGHDAGWIYDDRALQCPRDWKEDLCNYSFAITVR